MHISSITPPNPSWTPAKPDHESNEMEGNFYATTSFRHRTVHVRRFYDEERLLRKRRLRLRRLRRLRGLRRLWRSLRRSLRWWWRPIVDWLWCEGESGRTDTWRIPRRENRERRLGDRRHMPRGSWSWYREKRRRGDLYRTTRQSVRRRFSLFSATDEVSLDHVQIVPRPVD